jgi:Na+-driven multidrug efflux pump
VLRIAAPGIAERIVLNLGLLSYFWVLSRWYGTLEVAAYTVGIALLSFSWIPGTGYAQSCATLVGQSLGAGAPEEAMRVGARATALALLTAIPLAAVCVAFRIQLAELFTDDTAVIAALGPFMLVLALGQPFLQLHFTLGGAHRGAGDTWTPLLAAILGNWGLRIPLAIAFAGWLHTGVLWVWVALIADHITRATFLGLSFLSGQWRERGAGRTSAHPA